ncbi:uncharacterized protein B0H64DRAFT_408340 [Chaetomium fimeti]|uniref:DUF7580 domain-containing protein n=1 Tax=Chaetomium fimeti TaxID=1854472 RepID=A0AAE0LNS4_9PEZI|nr:hypothetical protein B0H64DRAFT_408340 [Chaetomium fimeti]
MSGFEIAGIILGSLPLLIPAIEHVRQSLSTRRYDQQLQSLTRNLKTERVKLQNVCEKLLDGLVPPSQIQLMISEPLGDLWRDEDTEKRIRGRLWDKDSYESFETAIQSISASVDDLAAKITAQRERQASLLKRGVFALKRTNYTETLTELKDNVANLVTLTSQSIELEPSRRVRSYGRFLVILQNLSKSLYRAIQSSLTTCHCCHDVGLRLETRKAVIAPLDSEDDITRHLEFRVAVSCNPEAADKEALWREMMALKTVTEQSTAQPPPLEAPLATRAPLSNKAPSALNRFKGKKSVSFTASQFAPRSTTSTLVETTASTSTLGTATGTLLCTATGTLLEKNHIHRLPIRAPTAEPTLTLCGDLQAIRTPASCLRDPTTNTEQPYGIIVDASRKYAVYPTPPNSAVSSRLTTVSLRSILEETGERSPYLSCRDRLQMAVIIASSVVQLHGSPWLSNTETLTSRDIHFFVDNKGEIAISCGDPILVRRLADPSPNTVTDQTSEVVTSKRNPALLSLGYLLLELFLEDTMKSFRAPGEQAPGAVGNVLSDYITAQRALEKATFPSENYRSAVSRCLQGELHVSKPGRGFENEDYCREFYSGVIALLEKDLENA